MRHFVILAAAFLGFLLAASCGPTLQTKDQVTSVAAFAHPLNTETVIPNQNEQKGVSLFTLSRGSQSKQPPLVSECTVDLLQDVVINPLGGNIRAMYSAKIEDLDSCLVHNKQAVLYIASQKEFQVESQYRCKIIRGQYTVRCDGAAVKFNGSGHFQITISGNELFNPDDIKMRITFENI